MEDRRGAEGKRLPPIGRGDVCRRARCSNAAQFACTFCGQTYCAEHGARVSMYQLLHLHTDWPTDLIDLLHTVGTKTPRARIWLCERCQDGGPHDGAARWQ